STTRESARLRRPRTIIPAVGTAVGRHCKTFLRRRHRPNLNRKFVSKKKRENCGRTKTENVPFQHPFPSRTMESQRTKTGEGRRERQSRLPSATPGTCRIRLGRHSTVHGIQRPQSRRHLK